MQEPQPEVCHWSKKRMIIKYQLPSPFWDVNTHQACVHNEERAMRNRVIADTGEPNAELMYELTQHSRTLMRDLRPFVSRFPGMEEVVKSFPPSRRKRYIQAMESMMAEPICSRDARVKAFVKSEKLLIKAKDGDPRMIQARTTRFNIQFAQFTKAVEHALYNLKDRENPHLEVPMIAKGRNLKNRAGDLRRLWEAMENPVAVSLDLSRWDMHVTEAMIRGPIHQGYKVLINDPLFDEMLEAQINNKCLTEHGWKYTNPAGVTSGDMTTALGNCTAVIAIVTYYRRMLCYCAKNYARIVSRDDQSQIARLSRDLGVVREVGLLSQAQRANLTPKALLIYDDGDDHVFLVEKSYYPLVRATVEGYWKALGHVLKVEGFTEKFHQIEFCQTKPFKTRSGWVMSPNPLKVLATATVVSESNPDKMEYLRTVWAARMLLHQEVPLLFGFFKKQQGKAKLLEMKEFRHKASGIYQMLTARVRGRGRLSEEELAEEVARFLKQGINRAMASDFQPTPEERAMFADQWGVEADLQVKLENMRLPPIPKEMPLETVVKINGKLTTFLF